MQDMGPQSLLRLQFRYTRGMADSTTSLVIAGVAAAAAFGSAVVAILQAKSAKKQAEESASQAYHAATSASAAKAQAEAAGQQVTLMAAQVRAAEEANKLTAQALSDEREARTFKLSVKAAPFQHPSGWWLQVLFENNSAVVANIQAIELVFGDGTVLKSVGYWNGEADVSPKYMPGQLPATLAPGKACSTRFIEYGRPEMLLDLKIPDYRKPSWRKIKGIRVRANNQEFWAEEGDGHWHRQFEQHPSHPAKL